MQRWKYRNLANPIVRESMKECALKFTEMLNTLGRLLYFSLRGQRSIPDQLFYNGGGIHFGDVAYIEAHLFVLYFYST